MKWHKVEEYPAGSNEHVLVSSKEDNKRLVEDCFVARKIDKHWQAVNGVNYYIDSTDRWCHIDLPED